VYGFESHPVYVHTVRRCHHVNDADVALAERGETIEKREFSDGFGRSLQTRTLAEDVLFGSTQHGAEVLAVDQLRNAPAVGRRRRATDPVNVVVSGSQTYDNKGRAVEKWEPYYSAGWDYVPPSVVERGEKFVLFYDALGRVERTLSPN